MDRYSLWKFNEFSQVPSEMVILPILISMRSSARLSKPESKSRASSNISPFQSPRGQSVSVVVEKRLLRSASRSSNRPKPAIITTPARTSKAKSAPATAKMPESKPGLFVSMLHDQQNNEMIDSDDDENIDPVLMQNRLDKQSGITKQDAGTGLTGVDLYHFSSKKSTIARHLDEDKERVDVDFSLMQRTPAADRFKKRMKAKIELEKLTRYDSSDESEGSSGSEMQVTSHEQAFRDLQMSRSQTSNNTLSQLAQIGHSTIYAPEITARHSEERAQLLERYRKYFPQWLFELSQGYNILTYGFGSKLELLTEFTANHLDDTTVVAVNGFFPLVNIRSVLVLGH